MPAQTVIQVRRDTATNWSSTNPTLANGEMGYDTTNKLFKVGDGSTAWNSLKVMAQHDTGSAARPLLTGGAYLSGSGLVLSGLASNYASAPDSAALSITGDIDIRCKVALTDWTPSAEMALVGKYGTGISRSYLFRINAGGTIGLIWTPDGTTGNARQLNSSVANSITDGATKWVRATLDVNDGSGNVAAKFYTSDDGTTWTQLGTTQTSVGTSSIFDGTDELAVGATSGGASRNLTGTVYRAVIQNGYDGAGSTVFDANFETATADALAFTESSANAATVTINTTRYSYGVPNLPLYATTTATDTGDITYFLPFIVTKAISVDLMAFEVTSGPAAQRTVKAALYAATDDMQPSGSPVVDFGSATVPISTSGIFVKQITPVTIQPGQYLLASNYSGALAFRYLRGASPFATPAFGANPLYTATSVSQTHSSFPSSSPVPTTRIVNAAGPLTAILLRWKAA